MTSYLVAWEIDIEADTPEDAARQAREIQLNPHSIATVFNVSSDNGGHYFNADIDLSPEDES